MIKLTTKSYWNNAAKNAKFILDENDPIKCWLEEKLFSQKTIKKNLNCIEFGCYPGRYLKFFGDKGFTVSGVDYIDSIEDVKYNLLLNGIKVKEIYCQDIFNFKPQDYYHCVMSFGLIEHFYDWENVFLKHIEAVDNNGFLVIEVPNFRGIFQRIPRFLFDYRNYKRHNIASMNLKRWVDLLETYNFEIVYSGYFGGYDVWFEDHSLSPMKKNVRNFLLRFLKALKEIIYKTNSESKHFSSYIGIIAKRNG